MAEKRLIDRRAVTQGAHAEATPGEFALFHGDS
jgi:hypothetical protein